MECHKGFVAAAHLFRWHLPHHGILHWLKKSTQSIQPPTTFDKQTLNPSFLLGAKKKPSIKTNNISSLLFLAKKNVKARAQEADDP